jgi:hypothetical protein
MAHVLSVPTRQISNPVAMLVLMKTDDRLRYHVINYIVIG